LVDKILCRIHTTAYYTELRKPKPQLACTSEGTDDLPVDGTYFPKHVGAAKLNNKLIRIVALVRYSYTQDKMQGTKIKIKNTGLLLHT
jgi:hypothetical protein